MSSLLKSARQRITGRRIDLAGQVEGLDDAVRSSRGRVDQQLTESAEVLCDRVRERLKLSADHTVVALAGATGSGKSSTFNALTGVDIAAVGVRRPTTAWASAVVWGHEPATEVLDWLGVEPRHRSQRGSALDEGLGPDPDADLNGLVLLDLPDHDSTEVTHHLEVERLIVKADLMIWVLDPQKYADLAIHDRFLRPMARHREVMIVALNHIDTVAPARREPMLDDVRRLLEADGLQGVPVIGISAREGIGLDELKGLIRQRVGEKKSARSRFRTDVGDMARRLQEATGDANPKPISEAGKYELNQAVSDAAGVPVVVDAVERATRSRAGQAIGWPPLAWLSRLKPDPLRRLHLDLSGKDKDLLARARTSLPEATHVQRTRVDAAIRGLGETASAGMPRSWQTAVRRASLSSEEDLIDEVDSAVSGTHLGRMTVPGWCRPFQWLQWALLLTALVGLGWLAALAVMGYLQLPEPGTPKWQGIPIPTLLLVAGVMAGLLLAWLSRALVSMSAKARGRAVESRLRESIAEVTERLVLDPVETELQAYRDTRSGIERALG